MKEGNEGRKKTVKFKQKWQLMKNYGKIQTNKVCY